MPAEEFKAPKDPKSLSFSQTNLPNHFGSSASVSAQFMPSYVKLDKQVSCQLNSVFVLETAKPLYSGAQLQAEPDVIRHLSSSVSN